MSEAWIGIALLLWRPAYNVPVFNDKTVSQPEDVRNSICRCPGRWREHGMQKDQVTLGGRSENDPAWFGNVDNELLQKSDCSLASSCLDVRLVLDEFRRNVTLESCAGLQPDKP